MKNVIVPIFIFCILSLPACRIPFTEIGCDYFKQNPEEKKKKDILDILSSGHWYLAEYYVDGVDAMDTVRKYRVGEDISFDGFPTAWLSCERSNPLYSVTAFTKICSKLKERLVVGQDTFNILEPSTECYWDTTVFVVSYIYRLRFGMPFIYSVHDLNQLKNKDFIKFPLGYISYFDSTKNQKLFIDPEFNIEEIQTNMFKLKSKFLGVDYRLKFNKKL